VDLIKHGLVFIDGQDASFWGMVLWCILLDGFGIEGVLDNCKASVLVLGSLVAASIARFPQAPVKFSLRQGAILELALCSFVFGRGLRFESFENFCQEIVHEKPLLSAPARGLLRL
jgi:hypothetical protein